MNAMRIEKAYKAWGSELTTEITPVEADLGRFVDHSTPYIGREATLTRERSEIKMMLVYLSVEATDSDCRGNEPVYLNDEIVGVTTSGAFGHTVGTSLAFAYVNPELASAGTALQIQIMGERRPSMGLAQPAVDPSNDKIRA
jgi:dimethylglycine dehydrogenase